MGRRGASRAAELAAIVVAAALLTLVSAPSATAQTPPTTLPFDATAATPHEILATMDTAPARDILALVTGAPEAAAALRRLRAAKGVAGAIAAEGGSPEDFFGRLANAAAGSPDGLLAGIKGSAQVFQGLLDNCEKDGGEAAGILGRRIASLLPPSPAVNARIVVVPFLALGGFRDVVSVKDGDNLYLVSDLTRHMGDLRSPPPPREVTLKVLRAAASEAWRTLFVTHFQRPPSWPAATAPDIETLFAQTVAEGPATLFLFPDEFFPLDSLLEEPIARAFTGWNRAAEELLDPKRKAADKAQVLEKATRGDFWSRTAAIVGAEVAGATVRLAGREAYVKALGQGPRAVLTLYLNVSKSTKLPQIGKAARKAIESAVPAPTAPAGAG